MSKFISVIKYPALLVYSGMALYQLGRWIYTLAFLGSAYTDVVLYGVIEYMIIITYIVSMLAIIGVTLCTLLKNNRFLDRLHNLVTRYGFYLMPVCLFIDIYVVLIMWTTLFNFGNDGLSIYYYLDGIMYYVGATTFLTVQFYLFRDIIRHIFNRGKDNANECRDKSIV